MTEFRLSELLVARPGGWWFTGPLEPAMRYMSDPHNGEDAEVTSANVDNLWRVEFNLTGGHGSNVVGHGETEEEAWRYALGAHFGPPDDMYWHAGGDQALLGYLSQHYVGGES